MAKIFEVTKTNDRDGRKYTQKGTIAELVKAYSYTLDVGRSWQHEKGNAKINTEPKNINSLVKNLNNAVNNSAANGYAGVTFSAVEVKE